MTGLIKGFKKLQNFLEIVRFQKFVAMPLIQWNCQKVVKSVNFAKFNIQNNVPYFYHQNILKLLASTK